MNTAKEDYDKHLATIYSWMAGDANVALDHNRSFFRQLLSCAPSGLAINLGCGSGFQSIPLAEFGFSVLAVDSCASLLSELRSSANSLPIQTIHDDILNFAKYISDRVQLVTCMGDTLTHLDSLDAVQTLIGEVCCQLVEGGMLILTFRDLQRLLIE